MHIPEVSVYLFRKMYKYRRIFLVPGYLCIFLMKICHTSISALALLCSGLLPPQKVAEFCAKTRLALCRIRAAHYPLNINLCIT